MEHRHLWGAGLLVLALGGGAAVGQEGVVVRPRKAVSATASAAAPVVVPPAPAAMPAAFDRLEWVVELDRTYDNPFDPGQIALDATFTRVDSAGRAAAVPGAAPAVTPAATPTTQPGRDPGALTVPAFWYQPFGREADATGRERLTPAGNAHWLLRFAAPQAGTWQLVVSAKDQTGARQSRPITFTVGPARQPGFVRRAPAGPRYFQFDSGAAYFPVGMNISWTRRGLRDFESWFGKLGAAGGNFARVWAPLFSYPIESKRSGTGRYDLANSWYYDQMFELAGQNHLYVMFTLANYQDTEPQHHWPINAYNTLNGGPASQPADFIARPDARALYQRHLRYLIARYGAYTSLAFWELWNEQDPKLVSMDWVKAMAGYLKANDPYRHLVTSSYAGHGDPGMWKLPEIDLTQIHRYGDDHGGARDMAPVLIAASRQHDGFGKPHLVAEFGLSAGGADGKFDANGLGTTLHNGLWAGAFAGGAGGSCPWYWDTYVDPRNLYGTFTGLARFTQAVDWAHRKFEPWEVPSPLMPPGAGVVSTSAGATTQSTTQPGETFGDIFVFAGGPWGKHEGGPVVIERDGRVAGVLPHYMYGPNAAKDLHKPVTLKIDLARPSRMALHVVSVSDFANLRVFVDDKPMVDFSFSPLPGAPEVQTTKGTGKNGYYYQALIDKERVLQVPAGAHMIALDMNAGDWATLGSLTFAGALPARYTGLQTLALADAASGETLAWLLDPASHWRADQQGAKPRAFHACTLALPVPKPGTYRVDWWDTRRGAVVQSEEATASEKTLSLTLPAFQRDIALRAVAR